MRQLGIGKTLPSDLRHYLNEASRVVAIFAVIEAKHLFGNICVEMNWFD